MLLVASPFETEIEAFPATGTGAGGGGTGGTGVVGGGAVCAWAVAGTRASAMTMSETARGRFMWRPLWHEARPYQAA